MSTTKTKLPWIEKYRPKVLSDIVHQEQVVAALRSSLKERNLPHLLFYGSAGTGKTSAALACCHELFGPKFKKDRVMELNASDERGINVVREKIKNFAQLSVREKRDPSYPYPVPPFKVIILDEADSMTNEAQAALRRTMEVYSNVTRFILICNYVSRIIEPVTSRCAKFRFKTLPHGLLSERIKLIAENEGLQIDDDGLKTLFEVSNGDLRKGITLLQSTYRMFKGNVSSENILDVAGVVKGDEINRFFDSIKSKSLPEMQSTCQYLMRMGYPANQVLKQFHDLIIKSDDINDVQRSLICIKMAEMDKNFLDGADEYLGLLDLAAYSSRQIHNGV